MNARTTTWGAYRSLLLHKAQRELTRTTEVLQRLQAANAPESAIETARQAAREALGEAVYQRDLARLNGAAL